MSIVTLTCSKCAKKTEVKVCPNCEKDTLTATKKGDRILKISCKCGHGFDKYKCKHCNADIHISVGQPPPPKPKDPAKELEEILIFIFVLAVLFFLFTKIY